MDQYSTRFVSYPDVHVEDADIYEDAFGLNTEFNDVIDLLGKLKVDPGKDLTEILIEKVRKQS